MILYFLRKLHGLENGFFFQNWRYFDNFHCTDRVISIRSNLLQSKSTDVRTANDKLLTTNRSLMFAENVDLKGSILVLVSSAAFIRVVTQRFSPTGGEALRDDPNNGCGGGKALRDDPNNGCGGDYFSLGLFPFAEHERTKLDKTYM